MTSSKTRTALLIAAACLLGACGDSASDVDGPATNGKERLTARPLAGTVTDDPGTYELHVAETKDAVLVIPESASPTDRVPLVVMLHGAGGGSAGNIIRFAEDYGYAVVSPKSRGITWDAALNGIGPDVAVFNKALEETFKRVRVDPAHIAIAGISDGASYAITMGIANGDLFTHIMAFAPGFVAPVNRVGKPTIFIAHGIDDGVLPYSTTEKNIVPFLKTLGYTVRFDSFIGGHTVTDNEANLAMQWFLGL